MTQAPPPQQRLRITYGKDGALIYTGHLDMARLWERIARRAALPLAYSHGFNPRPRLQMADALPLGVSSACEIIDMYMKTPVSLDGLGARLEAAAPEGLAVFDVAEVALKGAALQTLIDAADYLIRFPDGIDPADLDARIAAFLDKPRVEHVRRGKRYDLRPLVRRLTVTPEGILEARLSLGAGSTARPDALLEVLGLGDAFVAVHRKTLYLRSALTNN